MDFAQSNSEVTRLQANASAKKRLESFQFRPSSIPQSPTHANGFFQSNSSSTASLAQSYSLNSVSSDTSSSPGSRPASLSGTRSRPTSHHRRRSSVSTRVESAEMMGVALPDMPATSSDDNINFGDKDSIRRRALLALEGRTEFGSNRASVEIPDLDSQVAVRRAPENPHKPSFTLSSQFGSGNNISGKRDSFGKLLASSNSLRDQLHTLLEEEEEEEDSTVHGQAHNGDVSFVKTPIRTGRDKHSAKGRLAVMTPESPSDLSETSSTPELSVTEPSPIPARHRPASLSLRPLSLMSNNASPSLPTPSMTPSPRPPVLRKLSLTASESSEGIDSKESERNASIMIGEESPSPNFWGLARRTSLSREPSVAPSLPKRQSSISYIHSGSSPSPRTSFVASCLPTPGATPTTEKRHSIASTDSARSLSRERRTASEEVFMQQSHASLLARIAELESALQSNSRTRPISMQSNASIVSSEPGDEMLQLVADLKAERDELNRDIDGWRQRVRDLERTKSQLEKRLDVERRDGWLKGEKLGLIEIENKSLSRELKLKNDELSALSRKLQMATSQLKSLESELEMSRKKAEELSKQMLESRHRLEEEKIGLERELANAREALTTERAIREDLLRLLQSKRSEATGSQAHNVGDRFRSIDSACTTVETIDEGFKVPFTLKAVEEEVEGRDEQSEEENELAHYEDEDSDLSFTSQTQSVSSSSFDDDLPRSVSHLTLTDADRTPVLSEGSRNTQSAFHSPSPSPSPCPTPVAASAGKHVAHASLSKTWTFPAGNPVPSPRREAEEIDHFFGCLEDIDEQSSGVLAVNRLGDKSAFSQGLRSTIGDEFESLPVFVIPAEKNDGMLEPVVEEEEFDSGMMSARNLSFPTSISDESLIRSTSVPDFTNIIDEDDSVQFVFPTHRLRTSDSPNDTTTKQTLPTKTKFSSRPSPMDVFSVFSNDRPRTPNSPVNRPNIFVTPVTPNKPKLATRIPPPSPPKQQTKGKSASNAGKRKPVPSMLFSSTPKTKPSKAEQRRPGSPKKSLKFTPGLNFTADEPSTFVRSVNEPPKALTSVTQRVTVNDVPQRLHEPTTFTPAFSGLSLHTLTSFIPIPSLLWPSKDIPKDTHTSKVPRGAARRTFVSREAQLARLEAMKGESKLCTFDACCCSRCDSVIISL